MFHVDPGSSKDDPLQDTYLASQCISHLTNTATRMSFNENQAFNLAMDSNVFSVLVAATTILASKMLLSNFYSAVPKVFCGMGAPEDSWFFQRMIGVQQHHGVSTSTNDDDRKKSIKSYQAATVRAQRVVMNDLENIPISLLIFWMAGLASDRSMEVIWLLQIFTVARVMHTLVYYAGITVLRSLIFMVGYVTVFRAMYLSWQGVH